MIQAGEEADADTGGETGGETGAVLMPLVDVVFMLVVFLLLTANSIPFALDVDLPLSGSARAAATEQPVAQLGVGHDGWTLDGIEHDSRDATRAALASWLDGAPDGRVVIAVDRDVPAQRLIATFDLARAAGASHVDIAADPLPDAP